MLINALRQVTRFYSYVYLVLLIVTPIFILGGFTAAFFSRASADPIELKERFLIPGGRLLFGTLSFYIWWQIFHRFSAFFNAKIDKALLAKVSKLLGFAFAVEIIESVIFAAYPSDRPNWSEISFPAFSDQWASNVWMTIQWLLKVSASAGFFITPRTTGLASLLMAGIFYFLWKRYDSRDPQIS